MSFISLSPVHSVPLLAFLVALSQCSTVERNDVIQDGDRRYDDTATAVTFVYNVILCVVVATSLTTLVFSGLCICCRRASGNYIGKIDLADIQVIYNPSALSSVDYQRLNNANHTAFDSTVLENTALENTQVINYSSERSFDNLNKPNDERRHLANTHTTSAKLSNVLVENGRIVLQYTNVNANDVPSARPLDIDVTSSSDAGWTQSEAARTTRVPPSGDSRVETDDYDMNDVVWKNPHAKD